MRQTPGADDFIASDGVSSVPVLWVLPFVGQAEVAMTGRMICMMRPAPGHTAQESLSTLPAAAHYNLSLKLALAVLYGHARGGAVLRHGSRSNHHCNAT